MGETKVLKTDRKCHIGYNGCTFYGDFFIFTEKFAKNGYLGENKTPLYIHFFG